MHESSPPAAGASPNTGTAAKRRASQEVARLEVRQYMLLYAFYVALYVYLLHAVWLPRNFIMLIFVKIL